MFVSRWLGGEAWLAPAKVMYDHTGLRAERARTLGVSGWEIGNSRPGAGASITSPWCSVLKSPAVASSTWVHRRGGFLAGWRDRWAVGTGPGPPGELQALGAWCELL